MRTLILAILATLPAAADAPNPAVESLKKDIGAYGWRVLETATVVEVTETPADGPHRDKDQGENFAKRLRQAILEGLNSGSKEEKECKFEPLVCFRFVSGSDHVDLRLDFACERFELEAGDPKAPDVRSAHRYFDDSRAALVRLAKEAMPGAELVQKLKEWAWEPDAGAAKEVGKHGTKVLLAADRVEVYRIKPEKGDPAAKERQIAGGYPVISQGPDLGPAFACRLATLLLKGLTHPGFDKQCEFSPGVVFVVKTSDDHADLVLCFTCDELQSISYPKTAPDAITGHFDMEKSRAPWLELAKQALPADETIQKLENTPK